MEKLNFDIEKYQSLKPDEKVGILSKIFFKYLNEDLITEDLSEEDIEDIYNQTKTKIQKIFQAENKRKDDGFKMVSDKNGGWSYFNEKENIVLNSCEYSQLVKSVNLFSEYGFRSYNHLEQKDKIDRTKIGYQVFSRFKDFIKNQNISPQIEKSKLTAPVKIALLECLGMFTKLIKDGVNPENEYKIIHDLIGGSYSNIKKYCLNRKNGNKSYPSECLITDKHREDAKKYYNSKTS